MEGLQSRKPPGGQNRLDGLAVQKLRRRSEPIRMALTRRGWSASCLEHAQELPLSQAVHRQDHQDEQGTVRL